jgi:hypothetical protein
MRTPRITRRHVLRGALGGAAVRVALPALDLMVSGGEARAQAAAPKRFMTFFFGNGRGVEAARWTPAATGAGWTPSPQLAPLAKVKDYVNVVSGFDSKLTRSSRGHHNGVVTMLSGTDYKEQPANGAPFRSTFAGPSIDQVVARELGKATPFRSIEIGISSRVVRGEGSTLAYVSHSGPDGGNPPEYSPAALFGRLFAKAPAAAQASSAAAARLAQLTVEMRKSVLDAVAEDLRGLGARVGARDRARLEQHAETVREIEKRLAAPAMRAGACATPAGAADPSAPSGREPLEERMQLMSRLIATAFACDLTRVGSILFNGSVGSTVFWQVGASGGHHNLSHEGTASQKVMDAAATFTMKQFATLLEALRGTPEGDGHLLDRCAILATSDCSNGSAHSTRDMPIVIAGRAGGALRYPGVHHRGTTATDNNTGRVLLTLLRATGLPLTEFGGGGGRVTTGLPEIEAGA